MARLVAMTVASVSVSSDGGAGKLEEFSAAQLSLS